MKKMHNLSLLHEQRQARVAVVGTACSMIFLIVTFLDGVHWVGLVFSLAFMGAYMVERARISRRLVSLLEQRLESPSQAGASWPA